MTAAAWPFRNDNALMRVRRIALAYREELRQISPDACAVIDSRMRQFGQSWVCPEAERYEDHDDITTEEAAALVDVSEALIRSWACTPHPGDPSRMVLPRYGWRQRQRTYLVVHVREAVQIARANPLSRRRS